MALLLFFVRGAFSADGPYVCRLVGAIVDGTVVMVGIVRGIFTMLGSQFVAGSGTAGPAPRRAAAPRAASANSPRARPCRPRSLTLRPSLALSFPPPPPPAPRPLLPHPLVLLIVSFHPAGCPASRHHLDTIVAAQRSQYVHSWQHEGDVCWPAGAGWIPKCASAWEHRDTVQLNLPVGR